MTSKTDEKRRAQIDKIKKGMKDAERWQVTRRRLFWVAGGVVAVGAICAFAYYVMQPVPITDDDFITVQDEL